MNFLLLISTFISAIRAVELLMPTSAGKDKLDAALAIVEGIVGDIKPMVPALTAIATTVVTGLRLIGAFKTPAK